jgi:hypothetical protein
MASSIASIKNNFVYSPQNDWTEHHEKLLIKWRTNAIAFEWCHKETAKLYEFRHNLYGFLSAVLSVITGTVIIAKMNDYAQCNYEIDYTNVNFYILVVIGSISIISGIMSTITTFFKYSEWAEKHKNCSDKWHGYIDIIDTEFAFVRNERSNGKTFVRSMQLKYSELLELCPNISAKIEKSFKKKRDSLVELNDIIIDESIIIKNKDRDSNDHNIEGDIEGDRPNIQDELEMELRGQSIKENIMKT